MFLVWKIFMGKWASKTPMTFSIPQKVENLTKSQKVENLAKSQKVENLIDHMGDCFFSIFFFMGKWAHQTPMKFPFPLYWIFFMGKWASKTPMKFQCSWCGKFSWGNGLAKPP
jgi:hypothetical protein